MIIHTMVNVLDNSDELMNLSQAARELGVTRQTLYRIIQNGEIHIVIRLSGLPFVDRGEVEELKRRRSGESE